MSKILITGATGQLGRAVIERLLQKTAPGNIVAFARDENKAKDLVAKGIEVRYGNFDDTISLTKAVQGIEKILLISTVDSSRYQQHKNVVDAAKKGGLKHIGYTSVEIKNINASPVKNHLLSHYQTEDYIKESGLSYSIFQNSLYADMISVYVGKQVFEKGIYLPTGDGKVAFALRSEMGEGIANALWQNDTENKTYHITGSELYSFQDVAQVLSEIAGRTLVYTDADAATFPETLRQSGVPERLIGVISGFTADIKQHQYEIVARDLEKLLERKPATLKDALKTIYASGNR